MGPDLPFFVFVATAGLDQECIYCWISVIVLHGTVVTEDHAFFTQYFLAEYFL